MSAPLSVPSALAGIDLAGLSPQQAADLLNEHSRGSLAERMGITLVTVTPDRVEATMPVAGNTQPYGLLHGGASVVLAESIGSLGASLAASRAAGEPHRALGIEINASHLRSLREGLVRAVAVPLSVTRTLSVWSITVSEDGPAASPTICAVRLTCALRPAGRRGP